MTFNNEQVRMLKAAVPRRHVRERQADGKTLHYLEGWRVVTQANRIFGFDAWDRETVSSECVWRAPVGDRFAAAYLTRVRISVRAGDRVVVREGLGSGEAIAPSPGQAHEWASKGAETDATKRALSTFGASFGLLLYGERSEAKPRAKREALGGAAARVVGKVSETMRERTKASGGRISDGGWTATRGSHPFHREPQPSPGMEAAAAQGVGPPHKAEGGAAAAAAGVRLDLPPLDRAPGAGVSFLPVFVPPGRVDKSVLAIPEPRRVRDKEHLKFVARQPCVACGRTPAEAHHLRIAQPRALGRKSSDEFTVPLCALHHRELHMRGDEAAWWGERKIDPMPEALRLWQGRRNPGMDADAAQ